MNLEVYNIKGQKVKTLPISCRPEFIEGSAYGNNTPRPSTKLRMTRAGSYQYSATWNGKDNSNKTVASGIYYYKISAGKDTAMKKMLLLK